MWNKRVVSIQMVRLRILWIRQGLDKSRDEGDTGIRAVRNSGVNAASRLSLHTILLSLVLFCCFL